jgi:hypothetical protein
VNVLMLMMGDAEVYRDEPCQYYCAELLEGEACVRQKKLGVWSQGERALDSNGVPVARNTQRQDLQMTQAIVETMLGMAQPMVAVRGIAAGTRAGGSPSA